MLKNNEPYRYAQPCTVEAKFSRLRIRATGQKKKTTGSKGQKRPTTYGSGQRTRAVPALDQVYANEQLPSLGALAPGKQAMLQRQRVAEHVARIRTSYRVPRREQP